MVSIAAYRSLTHAFPNVYLYRPHRHVRHLRRKPQMNFPTIGDPPFIESRALAAEGELLAIGIQPTRKLQLKEIAGKSDYYGFRVAGYAPEMINAYRIYGEYKGWKFYRAWYYWIVSTEGPGISEVEARELNGVWREQVRVNGFAGGQDVRGRVKNYHVDTTEGLVALVRTLRDI